MLPTDDYAAKVELLLGCNKAADALHHEFRSYVAQHGMPGSSTPR